MYWVAVDLPCKGNNDILDHLAMLRWEKCWRRNRGTVKSISVAVEPGRMTLEAGVEGVRIIDLYIVGVNVSLLGASSVGGPCALNN